MTDSHEISGLPPEPRVRSITPAPEDYRTVPPFTAYLWPLAFFAAAAWLIRHLAQAGWPAGGAH